MATAPAAPARVTGELRARDQSTRGAAPLQRLFSLQHSAIVLRPAVHVERETLTANPKIMPQASRQKWQVLLLGECRHVCANNHVLNGVTPPHRHLPVGVFLVTNHI